MGKVIKTTLLTILMLGIAGLLMVVGLFALLLA